MRADGNSGNCYAFRKFFSDIEQRDRVPMPVANTPFRRRQNEVSTRACANPLLEE